MEIAVGELGDGASVHAAIARRDDTDWDAVNNRGVEECAQEAARVGAKSMVVIDSAWVTKPYSLAGLLFNSLYATLPMALHLRGEYALRRHAVDQDSGSGTPVFNYVIVRAGRLVSDEDYPTSGPTGLTLAQGDDFGSLDKPEYPAWATHNWPTV
jgi:hypothetical protein